MNLDKYIIRIAFLVIAIYSCHSQDSQYELSDEFDLIFSGISINEAMTYETSIGSKLEKPHAKIVLSPKLYPYVDRYNLGNPKEFSRNIPKNISAFIEYYYDENSKEVKYVSYKWAFLNKIGDDILFDRKKLKILVEKECAELNSYNMLFSKLEEIISTKHSKSEKTIKQNHAKNKKIVWKSDTSVVNLSLEFQDCQNQDNLLPGWFVVSLVEYHK